MTIVIVLYYKGGIMDACHWLTINKYENNMINAMIDFIQLRPLSPDSVDSFNFYVYCIDSYIPLSIY